MAEHQRLYRYRVDRKEDSSHFSCERSCMMRYVHVALVIIRNLYIVVMVLPLWLWSAAYRYHFPGFGWLDGSRGIFSVLALFYGAFGLWFFAERAVEVHYSGKPSKGLTISILVIALTLFVAYLGAVIDRGRSGLGTALFFIGIDALPLILFICIGVLSKELLWKNSASRWLWVRTRVCACGRRSFLPWLKHRSPLTAILW